MMVGMWNGTPVTGDAEDLAHESATGGCVPPGSEGRREATMISSARCAIEVDFSTCRREVLDTDLFVEKIALAQVSHFRAVELDLGAVAPELGRDVGLLVGGL
jgi:hypothetical protein